MARSVGGENMTIPRCEFVIFEQGSVYIPSRLAASCNKNLFLNNALSS